MAQNLDYHGTESQRVGYCYEYDSANCSRAGRLYNWAEAIASADTSTTNTDSNVTIKGVCPDGWHLPSKSEFQRLASYVGDSASFGKRLKSSGGWLASGSGADEYGFRIVPSGYRWYDNLFSEQGESSYLRSSTGNASTSYGLIFSASSNTLKDGDAIPGQWYFSVRCVSDNY
jgi:uncharacterized protein (TIGR02145 family)